MKAKKRLTIITLVITVLSLIIAIIIGKNSDCIIYDISMSIFGGATLGFIMSLTEYYVERQRAMEEFWIQAINILNELKKIKYLDVDAPINLIADAINEENSNAWREKFPFLNDDEKISVSAKKKLISWCEENAIVPFDKNADAMELEKLYESQMDGYKEVFFQCMDSYREASKIELGNLDNAYGNLDFLVANHTIRTKAYNEIFDKMRSIRNEIFLANTHFELWKHGKGNFVFCTDKVIEINKKLFIEEKSEEENVVSVSIYQKEFDDIEESLEKFRRKIYWGRSKDEVKRYPVSGRVLMRSKNDSGHIVQ